MRSGMKRGITGNVSDWAGDLLGQGARRQRARAWRLGMGLGLGLGALLGAGLMFVLDADMGRSRRAKARGKLIRAGHQVQDGLIRVQARTHDVQNRWRGRLAERRAEQREEAVSDEVLLERIRSKVGHVTTHPRNILVTVQDGHVTVAGQILAREVDAVIGCVQDVRGVRGVTNRLEVHEEAGNLPSLQESQPGGEI